MNYRIVPPCNLHRADIDRIDVEYLVEYFADNYYRFLYVYRGSSLVDVLTAKDISDADRPCSVGYAHRAYVWNNDRTPTTEELECWCQSHRSPPRVAVVVKGDLVFEAEGLHAVGEARGKLKSRLSLAFCRFFSKELIKWFRDRKIEHLAVIAADEFRNAIDDAFPFMKMTYFYSASSVTGDYGIVMDFRYFRLVRFLATRCRFVPLFEILDQIALSRLTDKCREMGVSLRLYRIASSESIRVLSRLERRQFSVRHDFRTLLNDNEYLASFAATDRAIEFLKRNPYEGTALRVHAGVLIQDDMNRELMHVNNGVRRSCPSGDALAPGVHLFGPCTPFGLCVSDDETIASFLQCELNNRAVSARVVNYGCLQGQNYVLNTLLRVLTTPLRRGDHVAILDFFSEQTGIVDTSEWLNAEKTTRDHWFFDAPMHCNRYANAVLARHLAEDYLRCAERALSADAAPAATFLEAEGIQELEGARMALA